MNLYHLFRKVIKLPRPNEVWENADNEWNIESAYQYFKYTFDIGTGQIYGFWNVIQTGLLFYVAFANQFLAISLVIGAIIGFVIIGHTLTVTGFIKRNNKLGNSQNPDIIEIRDNVRKAVKLIDKHER